MGWVIVKQNTSLKMTNTATGAILLTNLQVLLQKIDIGTFSIYHAAGPATSITMKISEITSIGGSAAAGNLDAVFNQIAAILN